MFAEAGSAASIVRPELAHALAWRVIAELLRRHHAQLNLRVFSYFPRQDPWGVMQLATGGGDENASGITFHVGGGMPGAIRINPFGTPREDGCALPWPGGNWALALLASNESKKIVGDIEAVAGLAYAGAPGESTPQVLAARVIAELLDRRALGRQRWRASCALISDVETQWTAKWAAGDGRVASLLRKSAKQNLERFWLLHRVLDHGGPADSLVGVPESCIAFDFATGLAWDPYMGDEVLDLCELYQRAGRKLAPLVGMLDATFGQ